MARMAYVAMAWPRSVPYNYRFKYVSIYVCAVMCCCAWSIIERAATATLNQIYIYIYIYIYISCSKFHQTPARHELLGCMKLSALDLGSYIMNKMKRPDRCFWDTQNWDQLKGWVIS